MRSRLQSIRYSYYLLFLLSMQLSIGHALEIQPLTHQLNLSLGNTYSTLELKNTTASPVMLDITSYRLELDSGRPYAGQTADDELLAFPPAVVLQPNQSQVVRIQWLLGSLLKHDRSYLVVIEQLPPSNAVDGVQMLLAFNAVVHVQAFNSAPDIQVAASEMTTDNSAPVLKVNLHNKGNGNGFGRSIGLVIGTGIAQISISPDELANYAPDLFFPPDYQRTILIPLGDLGIAIADHSSEISVNYDDR